MTEVNKILCPAISRIVKQQQEKADGVWSGSKYAEIKRLEIDKRGEVGEVFVEEMLTDLGIQVKRSHETDRTKKHWDIRDCTNGHDFEVKFATQGTENKSYQYEGFEKDRNYAGVILVALAPNNVYITCAAKRKMPFAKGNNHYTISIKKMHRREHGTQYKWTLARRDVEGREIVTVDDFGKHYYELLEDIKE